VPTLNRLFHSCNAPQPVAYLFRVSSAAIDRKGGGYSFHGSRPRPVLRRCTSRLVHLPTSRQPRLAGPVGVSRLLPVLGTDISRLFGGRPKQAPSPDWPCPRHPPLEGRISHLATAPRRPRGGVVARPLGNLVGAIGWPPCPCRSLAPRSHSGRGGGAQRFDARGPPPPTTVQLGPASRGALPGRNPRAGRGHDSYLVDSASSHMLVSKIKPCMSKYKQYIP
jgi:hypothetical protein